MIVFVSSKKSEMSLEEVKISDPGLRSSNFSVTSFKISSSHESELTKTTSELNQSSARSKTSPQMNLIFEQFFNFGLNTLSNMIF